MDFMESNKRRPSKFIDEERGMRNWWKHQQKLMNAGALKPERIDLFKHLLEKGEKYKHINQCDKGPVIRRVQMRGSINESTLHVLKLIE